MTKSNTVPEGITKEIWEYHLKEMRALSKLNRPDGKDALEEHQVKEPSGNQSLCSTKNSIAEPSEDGGSIPPRDTHRPDIKKKMKQLLDLYDVRKTDEELEELINYVFKKPSYTKARELLVTQGFSKKLIADFDRIFKVPSGKGDYESKSSIYKILE